VEAKVDKTDIDRGATEPAYSQLFRILKKKIENGDYLPGDRLPSESALCKRYLISPMTVRRSIKALLDQRLVTTIQGSGTFVKGPSLGGVTFSMEEFLNLFRENERIKVRILEVLINKADQVTAERLAIRPGERTILIKRLLIRDGDPILYHKEQLIYEPTRPIVEAELEVTSLHGLFVGGGEGTLLRWGELTIDVVALAKEEANLLNTIQSQPAFCFEHTFYDLNDKPISWGRFVCRRDHLRFKTIVGSKRKPL